MGAILAPGTVLLPDTLIPTSQLWAGNPGVYIRDVTEAEVEKTEKVKQLPRHPPSLKGTGGMGYIRNTSHTHHIQGAGSTRSDLILLYIFVYYYVNPYSLLYPYPCQL